jgi:putative DNA primase/helicase
MRGDLPEDGAELQEFGKQNGLAKIFTKKEFPTVKDREEQIFQDLLQKYQSAVCTSEQLETLPITPRVSLIGKWMKEGDTGFVYGERGHGKTWFVYLLATHLTSGEDIDENWTVPASVDVLLVDGEMPIDDCRNRLKGLSPSNKRLHLLHHEHLFNQTGLVLNLTNEKSQKIVTQLCVDKKIKLLILDNLSCLFSCLKENDADSWELVLNWLLDLRRRRIVVLIVHHAGRSGNNMRGTSRREDAAFWVISVKEITDRPPDQTGAYFASDFTKQRNSGSPELTRKWSIVTDPDGTVSAGCQELPFDEKVLNLIQAGINTCSELAEELSVNKSTIKRALTRLIDKKFVERRGSGARVTYEPRGVHRT